MLTHLFSLSLEQAGPLSVLKAGPCLRLTVGTEARREHLGLVSKRFLLPTQASSCRTSAP